MKSKQEIKKFFENGDIPNQEQFWDWQDSYWHKDEKIPSDKVDIDLSQKADLVGGKVPAAQLPSYVDDVAEFASFAALPTQGEQGKIYITTDNEKLYRWSGSLYIQIESSENQTLRSIITNGNYSPRFISFIPENYNQSSNEGSRDAALGVNPVTYSFFFGNMNPMHTGTYNSSFGYSALQKVTTGESNVALSPFSMTDLTTGSYNTALGVFSLNKATSGVYNLALGHRALFNSSSGYKNIALGASSLHNITTGAYNIALGTSAGYSLTWHNGNILIGAQTAVRVSGNNNLFIGNGAGYNTIATPQICNNRLVIHNNSSLSPSTGNENAMNSSSSIDNGLIIGDFDSRWIKFNGAFAINPNHIPNADETFTKSLVAKSDGSFGWTNRTDTEYIPLTGTPTGKPVTGDIFIKNGSSQTMLSPGYIYCSDLSDNGTVISTASVKFLEANQGTADFTKSGITTVEGEFIITCYKPDASGLTGYFDYTENLKDLDYVQKKYVDKKQSHSDTEVKTEGTWINGKPIYRRTVVYNTIPSNGEIDITNDFIDVEMIVSNQMFTEWYAIDVAFAGNQWRGQAFITLQPKMAKIEDIKNLGYNYSLIDSFTLTLEYTKTTD
jgi:hypothetical protein